jgi:muramoyltetrapeptide carboxypeptidase
MPPRTAPPHLKPHRLLPGAPLVLIAPARPPLQLDVIDRAVSAFTSRGLRVKVARHAQKRHGFIAGKDRLRLSDLHTALRDRTVKALLCVRGGYGIARILPDIDLPLFRKHPKILLGCSDITALHATLSKAPGLVTFHGPMAQSLVDTDCPEFTWRSALVQLTGDNAALGPITRGYPLQKETVYSLKRGKVTAPLIGGNLAVLCSLLGTKFFPDLSGKILLIEEIGEMPFRIDRYLTQLTLSGALDRVAGFALGLFKDCEYRPPKPGDLIEYKQSLRDVFHNRLTHFSKPVVVGLPFGHMPYNATLPLSCLATLDGGRGELVVEELGVT